MARKLALHGVLIFGGWTLYALLIASQNYFSRAYSARIPMRPALTYALSDSFAWAVLTPLILLVAGWFLIRGRNWWWTIPVLFVSAAVFSALHLLILLPLLPLAGYKMTSGNVQSITLARFQSDIVTCCVLIGLRHGIDYYRQFRTRERQAIQLESRLMQAQLEMLKMQLQPHFLFNTLHAISTLMYRDPEGADRMIARLSDFLRLTLESAGVQQVTLKREMEYLDKYLEIEQVRFAGRLAVHRAIDAGALDLLVPNLVLQPLVENAVRHGIAPRASGGRIDIRAHCADQRLTIEVSDDGVGAAGEIREGVGIANTRARISQMYNSRASLELASRDSGGFVSRLTIPCES